MSKAQSSLSLERSFLDDAKKYGLEYTWRESLEPILAFIGSRLGVDIGFASVGWSKWADWAMVISLGDKKYALIGKNGFSYWDNIAKLLDQEAVKSGNIVFRNYLTNTRGDVVGIIHTPLTDYISWKIHKNVDYREWVVNPHMIPNGVSILLGLTNTEKSITLTNKMAKYWYLEYGLSEKQIYDITLTIHRVTLGYESDRFTASLSYAHMGTTLGSPKSTLAASLWSKLLQLKPTPDITLIMATRIEALWQKTDGNTITHPDSGALSFQSGINGIYEISPTTTVHLWYNATKYLAPKWLLQNADNRNLKHGERAKSFYAGIRYRWFGIDTEIKEGFENMQKVSLSYRDENLRVLFESTKYKLGKILGDWKIYQYRAWGEYSLNTDWRLWIHMSTGNLSGTPQTTRNVSLQWSF
jgi:hypothetical protein